jgi:class 3 adenylate cyclase/predicted ATPase
MLCGVPFPNEAIMSRDVRQWLEDLGLGKYVETFAANDVDLDVLHDLDESDLERLGISLGHRKKLLRAIADLEGARTPGSRPARDIGDAGKPPTAAERRQLTVMFIDLVGSTALSSRLDPEEMREVIRAYQNTVAGEVLRFEGHVAKFMGDGVLAYFGWPKAHEDEAERAVRAALAIVEAVPKLTTPAKETLAARAGIATGLVVVGDLVGEGASQEQAVVGETPNLAARLQGLVDAGGVLVAEPTRRLLGEAFALADLGACELKGFSGPVRSWRVIGDRPAKSRFEAAHATGVTQLISRQHELSLLLDRWTEAKAGDGQVVLLSGEPGIGKSRITQAFRERIADEPHRRLRYQCSPYHTNSALYPVIGQLEFAAGFSLDDPPERKLTKLEALLGQATNDVAPVAPLFAALLSIPFDDRYSPLDLTPQEQKAKTLEALLAQLARLAALQPALMIMEDVHWIDPTTSELVGLIIERVASLPVLLVITFRPEFTPPWSRHAHVTALALNRLSRQHCAAMVEAITAGKALPTAVRDQIVAKTDGVPLFVEELTKTLLESGVLKQEADRYALTGPLPSVAIPDTLQDSLMARLDRLASVKDVAQIAAAIGREFSYEMLAAVAGLAEDELQHALDRLVQSELVFRRGASPNTSYLFKHALVRDAAYESLLLSRRRQLHARIAQALSDRFPDLVESQPEVLAYHCTEAGLTQQAVNYWLRAGDRDLQRSAYPEAVGHLTKGLEVQRGQPAGVDRARQELAYQAALGTALLAMKGYGAEETGRAFGRARALCEELGDAPQLFPVLYGEWAYQLVKAKFPMAREFARQFLDRATARQEPESLVVGHRIVGLSAFMLGDFSQAEAHYKEHLARYDPTQHRRLALHFGQDQRAACLANLAWLKWIVGRPDDSLATSRAAVAYSREFDHINTHAYVDFFTLFPLHFRRDVLATETQANALIALSKEKRMSMWGVWAALFSGWALGQRGNSQAAIAQIRDSLADARASGQDFCRPYFLTMLAQTLAPCGRIEAGLEALEEALALVDSTEERWWEAEIHRLKGELLHSLARQENDDVEAEFATALRIAGRQGAKSLELRAAISLAGLWAGRGERQRARNLLAPTYGWFTEGFDTPDLKEAKALLDELSA